MRDYTWQMKTAWPFAAAIASICITVLSQFVLKAGVALAAADGGGPSPWRLVAAALLQPSVWFGLALYGVAALVWLYVLASWDVSKAYPLIGLGLALSLLIGAFVFNEPVTTQRIAGAVVIFVGVVLVALS